jgi:hypothetical protein
VLATQTTPLTAGEDSRRTHLCRVPYQIGHVAPLVVALR